ncbi:hypothetical protein PsYK624_155840 [Phanerochaete sordida]|uniref:Uncharacterized protein n=1 Tax=Phanerochaete sordida TaxID=48140 RepID=A0A9P3GTB3_9APHY|nr:hypothetical protein PsYK624_155840 [Phanerochaete sordida]
MDCFPVETWLHIVALACTDGGRTGRALSLVSRKMLSVVDPIRFRCVLLAHEDQLRAFSRVLGARDPSPTIHHLLIFVKKHSGGEAGVRDSTENFENSLHKIISVAAPTVQTLAVHGITNDLGLCNLVFPVLHDLAIDALPSNTASHASCFPSLRRLHISSHSRRRDFWADLARFAPALTHLRLSGLTQEASLSTFLRVLLKLPAERWSSNVVVAGADSMDDAGEECAPEDPAVAAAVARLPALRHVVVQPLRLEYEGWCGEGPFLHGLMKNGLQRIASACAQRQGTRNMYLLQDGPRYSLEDARRDWLDAVEGGEGPWAEGSDANART